MADDDFQYESGFGNQFVTEAVKGALPVGRNSPQQAPLGLYAEQLSGTAFTQPRAVNRRTWVYRILPSRQAPGLQADRQQEPQGNPVRRDRTEPEPAPLGPAPAPAPDRTRPGRRAARLHRRPLHRRGQRRHQDPQRHGRPPLRRQQEHAGPLLRRLRRRAAVRPRAQRDHPAHRARPAPGQPGRDRGGPARHQVPGRTARRHRARLPVRELRRELHPPGTRPDRRQRPGQRAGLPLPARRLRGAQPRASPW